MMTEEIRAEKEALIESCYKSGLKALQQYAGSTGGVKESSYSEYMNQRCNLIVLQKAFVDLDGDLSSYCCELGLDLGDQALVIFDKEASAA